jgi:hypothetical protein
MEDEQCNMMQDTENMKEISDAMEEKLANITSITEDRVTKI